MIGFWKVGEMDDWSNSHDSYINYNSYNHNQSIRYKFYTWGVPTARACPGYKWIQLWDFDPSSDTIRWCPSEVNRCLLVPIPPSSLWFMIYLHLRKYTPTSNVMGTTLYEVLASWIWFIGNHRYTYCGLRKKTSPINQAVKEYVSPGTRITHQSAVAYCQYCSMAQTTIQKRLIS